MEENDFEAWTSGLDDPTTADFHGRKVCRHSRSRTHGTTIAVTIKPTATLEQRDRCRERSDDRDDE